jgi:hypothetical protein
MLAVRSPHERMAAVLHDVVEDTATTLDDLAREGFPAPVLAAVEALTKRPGEIRMEAARRAAAHPIACAVKLADVTDNMDLGRIAEPTGKDYARIREYEQVRQLLLVAGVPPQPPDDTPETRCQLHAAIRSQPDEASILEWIVRGADPSKGNDEGDNAYSLARQCGYPETFCQKMEEAFSRWLRPLQDTTAIYISDQSNPLWTTLEQHGWVRWCKGIGQLSNFAWSSEFRLYYAQWEMEAQENAIYGTLSIMLALPNSGFDEICQRLDQYGVIWSKEKPDIY